MSLSVPLDSSRGSAWDPPMPLLAPLACVGDRAMAAWVRGALAGMLPAAACCGPSRPPEGEVGPACELLASVVRAPDWRAAGCVVDAAPPLRFDCCMCTAENRVLSGN